MGKLLDSMCGICLVVFKSHDLFKIHNKNLHVEPGTRITELTAELGYLQKKYSQIGENYDQIRADNIQLKYELREAKNKVEVLSNKLHLLNLQIQRHR